MTFSERQTQCYQGRNYRYFCARPQSARCSFSGKKSEVRQLPVTAAERPQLLLFSSHCTKAAGLARAGRPTRASLAGSVGRTRHPAGGSPRVPLPPLVQLPKRTTRSTPPRPASGPFRAARRWASGSGLALRLRERALRHKLAAPRLAYRGREVDDRAGGLRARCRPVRRSGRGSRVISEPRRFTPCRAGWAGRGRHHPPQQQRPLPAGPQRCAAREPTRRGEAGRGSGALGRAARRSPSVRN